ncbi:hypothetical protein [Zavarzinella formosa]|uniref:hypothetical protein n=1 Tax=Zavarzinella formosa TaxID=360055 RepID=UPI0003025764|nr:hypothetical protein [Zavarzinella formosa]
MLNYGDVPQQLADMIRRAIAQDAATAQLYLRPGLPVYMLVPGLIHGTQLSAALEHVKEVVEGSVLPWRQMTRDEKDGYYKEVGKALGFPYPDEFVGAVKSSSNDAYMKLVNYIGLLLPKDGGKK